MNKIVLERGTKDIYGEEALQFRFIEDTAREVFNLYNFSEIKTPIFENTALFKRGIGDSTDIVNKEMYTFFAPNNNENSITLRPENTAGVVRAYIEHNFSRMSPPQKFWYFGPMFRYERPQKGRQRQFHQVGVEMFGSDSALADYEVIVLAEHFLKKLGLNNLTVEINSLGCKTCRDNYKNNIKEVLKPYLNELCEDCKMRYEKNPLRMLDCKNEKCQEIFIKDEVKKVILGEFICDECKNHFDELKKYLDEGKVNYKINKMLVRGLDYYNRTVFEIKSENLGSQNAVAGGGRYDSLISTLSDENVPAIGFAMGVERLQSLLPIKNEKKIDYYIISDNKTETVKLAQKLRNEGKIVDFDFNNKKFIKQLEKASKVANFGIILGEDEIKNNYLTIKNFETGEQEKVSRMRQPE